MASTLMTEFLIKLKKEVARNFTMNRKTFPSDEENCIENADISTETAAASNLVICKGEPSSFWMDDETNDKSGRRESEDSLLKFAINFSKNSDCDSSSSGECDTNSSRHHANGNIHGHELPTDGHADTGSENMGNCQNNNQNEQLNNDPANRIDRTNQDTYERGENVQNDTLNTSKDDEKSFTSEENQSPVSSPGASSGRNSHNGGLRQRGANRSRDDVENAEDNKNDHFQSPGGHLESYLYIMQFIGISAFRRVEYRGLGVSLVISLKVLFWTVSTCAFLNSLKILKRVSIEQAPPDKDLKYCVTIGFAVIRCFSRFYFIKLAGTQAEKLSVMLLHVRNLHLFTKDGKFSFSILALILATTTFVFSVTKVCAGYLFLNAWNWNDALKMRTFVFSNAMFAWSSDKNVTISLAEKFFNPNQTPTHVAMGLLEGMLDFCGTLQGEAIRDRLILAGLTILTDQKCFEQRIESQLLVHPNNTDSEEVEGSLKHFKCICQESSAINGTFVALFKFVSIQNLLLYAYLFIQLIGYEGLTMGLIHSTLDALRGLVLFYIGMQIHWKNSNIKRWLHRISSYTGPVDVESILGMSVISAIAELRDDPIGLGNDYFLINETFMVGLIAAVGSLISLLFEFDKQEAAIRRLLR